MPEFDFPLVGLIQSLENEVALAEAMYFPEISCLGEYRTSLANALETNAGILIESLDRIDLYRRHRAGDLNLEVLTVLLDPPARSSAWREPIEFRIPMVRWSHGEEYHLAYLPALGIEVVGSSEMELRRLLPQHVRAALLRGKKMSLAHLAPLQRCEKLEIEELSFTVALKSPLQQVKESEQQKVKEYRTLKEVGVDLTVMSLPEAFEVETTVTRVAEVLTGRTPRCVLLVGPSGVGKTAIVHELVRRRHDYQMGRTPFWATSGSRLVAGMSGFGMWQQRCQELWREASKLRAILHVGNLMELIDVGKSEFHSQGIASFLRPYLARGDLLVIAECLPEQKPLIERQDPHLLQAFLEVPVEEPSKKCGQAILSNYALSQVLNRPHNSPFPLEPAALEAIDHLHRRYATYSAYPGRPLRFLRNLLIDLPDYDVLTAKSVTAAFSRETGLPLFLLEDEEPLNLDEARRWFAARVIGQVEAIDLVVDLMALVKSRLTRPRKPIASLLFIGPTGVGKTEMAKALAQYLFGSEQRLTRFDMSEYADALAVQRLIGGGSRSEGLLTAKVREQPFSVILLDEFEKAHPLLFDLLLQVLGEGRLTDAGGKLADFCNSVVIMTSNLGAASYQQGKPGFGAVSQADVAQAREHFTREVQRFIRPELFNRIDRIIPFAPLDETTILGITRRQLDLLRKRDGIRYRGVTLEVGMGVDEWLSRKGYDVRYGARPLKRAIERELLAPLSERMNQYSADMPLRAVVSQSDDGLTVQVRGRVDEGGRQIEGTTSEVVSACVELRRLLQRMGRCSSMRELVNEIYRLSRIEKRMREGRKVAYYEDQSGMARLPHFRKLRNEYEEQLRQGEKREDDSVLGLHEEIPLDLLALSESHREGLDHFENLLRELYVLPFEDADHVTLAVFSEEPEALWSLAAAYAEIATQLRGSYELWQFLPEREKLDDPSPDRRRVIEPPRAFAGHSMLDVQWWNRRTRSNRGEVVAVKAREGVIGLALRITARYALPRFVLEEGLHHFISVKAGGKCLVESNALPLTGSVTGSFYVPPSGIERRGAIGSQAKRRVYQIDRNLVEDMALDRKLTWDGNSLSGLLSDLMEQILRKNAYGILGD